MTRLTRRGFLGLLGGAAAGAAVGVPLLSGLGGSSSTGTLLCSQLPLPRPFTLPLAIPPVLAPVRTDATTDVYELVQRAATVELLPGVPTTIWGYDGRFPGPTILSRSGRRTVVRHRNLLPVPVVVHLHGGRTPPEHDGYPPTCCCRQGWTSTPPTSTTRWAPSPAANGTTPTRPTRCSSGPRRCGATTTAWTSPARACGVAWPASTWCTIPRRTRCRCHAASGTCR